MAPSAPSTASTTSSRTLAHAAPAASMTTTSGNAGAKPEPSRLFTKPDDEDAPHPTWVQDDPDGEEAEREFADFGGDVPSRQAMPKTRRASMSTRRARSRSESLPPLYLVDSAYSESHRAMSRISRLEAEEVGGELCEREWSPKGKLWS